MLNLKNVIPNNDLRLFQIWIQHSKLLIKDKTMSHSYKKEKAAIKRKISRICQKTTF